MRTERVRVFGGDAVRASVVALGYEPHDSAPLAVIDLSDETAIASAAADDTAVRVFVCGPSHAALVAAAGVPSERVAFDIDPAILGPVIARSYPRERRSATRSVAVTSVRGGVGRTLLAVNLALRLASRLRVCVVDATGSGNAAWWLRCDARPWSEMESLADELSADQLGVIANEAADNLHLIGGRGEPTAGMLAATIRAATHLDDVVLVDLPPLFARAMDAARERADRTLVLAYDEPLSRDVLDASGVEGVWLIASQSTASRIGRHDVFRSLPRDEGSVRAAIDARARAAGALGRAYDELAELVAIDAS
ncbi:MAG TPA: ParA family protein [Candidatus Limnocylindria bacterium]